MRARSIMVVLALTLSVGPAIAQTQADKKKPDPLAEDIMDHRTMAEAHRKAADCLEAGKPEKECRAQLGKDCKGIAIGKHCGMKDRHKH
jgi:hypothetical protein